MKLEPYKALEVNRVGDMEAGVEAGISQDSLPFLFEMISKMLYSNPIGSVVREITSNCFDAHIEAGVDEPVIINKKYDADEGYSIEFQDKGIGMSATTLVKIYMSWLTSTKRETNEQIGGFGLGSKTPLAYSDLFYITTVHNGLKYECVLHKGGTKPELESFYGWDYIETEKYPIGEPTEEANGTVIRIPIKEGDIKKKYSFEEKVTFYDELKYQLAYFDNVYFKNWDITNDYDIYEGKYFKFRSDIYQSNTDIHICLGNVRYPIDFTKVKVEKQNTKVPIAVKFDIGELSVVPSRESLRYDEVSIAKIQARIDLAIEEIREIFQKQNKPIEDFVEYIRLRRNTVKITFNKEKGHGINVWADSGLEKSFIFKPVFDVLGSAKMPKEFFFMFECIGMITERGNRIPKFLDVDDHFINKKYIIADRADKFSDYTNIYIGSEVGDVYVIRRKKLDYQSILDTLHIKDSKKVGKAELIRQYIELMISVLEKHSYGYYKDLRPSEEWITNYKKSIIESTIAFRRKQNQQVFVRLINRNRGGVDIYVKEILNHTGIIIYGFKEDKTLLERIYYIIVNNKLTFRELHNKPWDKERRAFMVLQIAQTIVPIMIEAEDNGNKVVYCKNFFKTKLFRKIWTGKYIAEKMAEAPVDSLELRNMFLYNFESDLKAVKASYSKYWGGRYVDLEEHTTDFKPIPLMLTDLNKFLAKKEHFQKIPLSYAIRAYDLALSKEGSKEYASYLRYKGIRLCNIFYVKTKKQLEEEQREKRYQRGLKTIFDLFSNGSQQYLLTNTTKNQTDEQNSENSDNRTSEREVLSQTSGQQCNSIFGQEEDRDSSDDQDSIRSFSQEDTILQQETFGDRVQNYSENDYSYRDQEQGTEGELNSSSERSEEAVEESCEEIRN